MKAPLVARLWRVYREKGVAGFWFGALRHAGYRRLMLLERTVGDPLPNLAARVDATIRPLGLDDEAAFAALGQEDPREFARRLESGHQCWGAWVSGALRHVQWLALREAWIEHLGCRLRLHDGVLYVYRAFTQPEFRGAGLAPATHCRGLDAMREQGCTLALCGVAPGYRPALVPWLKVGYRPIGFASTFGSARGRLLRVRLGPGAPASRGWTIETPGEPA